MQRILGIDPSNQVTGLAVIEESGKHTPCTLVSMCSVRMFHGDPWRSAHERVVPIALEMSGGVCLPIAIEEVPGTSRKDSGHGKQAELGWRQGWVAAIICAAYSRKAPMRTRPSPWRARMLVESSRYGLHLEKPSRKPQRADAPLPDAKALYSVDRDGASFVKVYTRCAHRIAFKKLDQLEAHHGMSCRECRRNVAPKSQSAADKIRDDWKRTAYEFVSHYWPEQAAELVADAKSRARLEKPAHQYAGVSDACEAVGIALWGLHELRQSQPSS